MNIQDLIYFEERPLHEVTDCARQLVALRGISPSEFLQILH